MMTPSWARCAASPQVGGSERPRWAGRSAFLSYSNHSSMKSEEGKTAERVQSPAAKSPAPAPAADMPALGLVKDTVLYVTMQPCTTQVRGAVCNCAHGSLLYSSCAHGHCREQEPTCVAGCFSQPSAAAGRHALHAAFHNYSYFSQCCCCHCSQTPHYHPNADEQVFFLAGTASQNCTPRTSKCLFFHELSGH